MNQKREVWKVLGSRKTFATSNEAEAYAEARHEGFLSKKKKSKMKKVS